MNNTTDTTQLLNANTFMLQVETGMTFEIANYLELYWLPILVPIGLVGNTLSFLVMIKPNNRKMSTCIYMEVISINDNVIMFWAIYGWFVTALQIHLAHPMECKIVSSLTFVGMQNSTFQVFAMTLDKYIAIKWPHKAAIYSTPKRAKITISCILLCVVIYNIPHIFMTKMVGNVCVGFAIDGKFTKVYSWLSLVINGLVPLVSLIYMNFVIVQKVRTS